MGERYNKKSAHQFKVGDIVAVRIPRIDRASTDLHRLPCIVVQQHGKKHFNYRLRSEYGVLNTTFPASELEVYSGLMKLDVDGWESIPTISLREAAKTANPDNAFYGTSCSCKKGCGGKKCSCRQVGKPCSTRCHSGRSCSNCQDSTTEKTSGQNIGDPTRGEQKGSFRKESQEEFSTVMRGEKLELSRREEAVQKNKEVKLH